MFDNRFIQHPSMTGTTKLQARIGERRVHIFCVDLAWYFIV